MAVDINKLIEQTKNQRLKQQVHAGQMRAQALGGTAKKGGPSILSRIFDVISRPLYGVSEGLARASEHVGEANPRKGKNAATDILGGIAGGLAGKHKTDFGETLNRAAIADPNSLLSKPIRENRFNLRAGAGLAGSIAFDPLTYTGIGVAARAGKGAARVAGERAAVEVVENADSIKKVLEAGENARLARLERGAFKKKSGEMQTAEDVAKSADKKAAKVMQEKRNEIFDEARSTVGKAAMADTIAAQPGKIQLKFAGKTVAESTKIYNGMANLGKVVGSTEVGKNLNLAFRNAAKFPELTNRFRREVELKGIAHAEQEMKSMRDFFKDLTKEEKVMLSHAIEDGTDLRGLTSAAGKDMGDYQEFATNAFRTMGEGEVSRNVFRAKGGKTADDYLLDNYVYHYYEGGNKALRQKFKNARRLAVGPETPGFTKQRSLSSLREAKAAGLKPVEAIDDILAKRIGRHHQAVARANYVDAVVKEYGIKVGSKQATRLKKQGSDLVKVDSPYVPKDTVFPEHIARSLKTLEDAHDNDELYNSFIRVFDKAQNYWKFGATSMNPGHHIRNTIGDAWNNFVDGVDSPIPYQQASRALWGKDDGFKIRVGNVTVDRNLLKELNVNSGAKPGFTSTELLGNETSLIKGLRGKVNQVSEAREEYMRMAHFIDALKKEGSKAKNLDDLREAASKAAARVRKWNIDYGDVTDFERNVMKRAIPFYTWSRKNIPLQIEALAMRPGRVAVIPKGQAAIQRFMGTDEGGYANFGDLDTVPKWLKEMAPIRLRGEGEGKNSIYWVPALPFHDISRYIEGGEQGLWQNFASQATPAIRIPFERATGKQVFSGANAGPAGQYFAGQNPLLRNIYNIATGKQDPLSWKSANYISGLGIQEVTPGQVAGELRRQEDQTQAIIRGIREKARKKALGQ